MKMYFLTFLIEKEIIWKVCREYFQVSANTNLHVLQYSVNDKRLIFDIKR